MNDIYKTPNSNLDETETISDKERKILEETAALRALFAEQKYISTPINVLFVTFFILFVMSLASGPNPMLVYIVPAFLIGGMIKYIGKLIAIKHRIFSSSIEALTVFLFLTGSGINPLVAALISLFNFLICLVLSRRPLSFDQEKLLFSKSVGKISL